MGIVFYGTAYGAVWGGINGVGLASMCECTMKRRVFAGIVGTANGGIVGNTVAEILQYEHDRPEKNHKS